MQAKFAKPWFHVHLPYNTLFFSWRYNFKFPRRPADGKFPQRLLSPEIPRPLSPSTTVDSK